MIYKMEYYFICGNIVVIGSVLCDIGIMFFFLSMVVGVIMIVVGVVFKYKDDIFGCDSYFEKKFIGKK